MDSLWAKFLAKVQAGRIKAPLHVGVGVPGEGWAVDTKASVGRSVSTDDPYPVPAVVWVQSPEALDKLVKNPGGLMTQYMRGELTIHPADVQVGIRLELALREAQKVKV